MQLSFTRLESKPVLAIALLPYLLPDTRLKADGSHKNNQVCWCKFSSVCCTRKKLTIASIQLQKNLQTITSLGASFFVRVQESADPEKEAKGLAPQPCLVAVGTPTNCRAAFFLFSTCVLQWVVQTFTSFWSITFLGSNLPRELNYKTLFQCYIISSNHLHFRCTL